MYLFSLSKKNIVLHPDAVKLTDHLCRLDDDDLRFVILSTDYYSPLRQLPEDERYRRAKAMVYGNKDGKPWLIDYIKKSMDEYYSLQYDDLREEIRTYRDKMGKINDTIRATDDTAVISKLMKTNTEIRKRVLELEEEVLKNEEQESIELKGKGQLSFLELAVRNKERYTEIIRRREMDKPEMVAESEEMPTDLID